MEPLRAHDNKQAGEIPAINWECTRWHLKTSEYPCHRQRESQPGKCLECPGAKKIGTAKLGRPRKPLKPSAPQEKTGDMPGTNMDLPAQAPAQLLKPGKPCKEPGCKVTKLYGRGYCRSHWKKHVGVDFQTKQTPPEGKYYLKLKGKRLGCELFISQNAAKEIMMAVLKELDCMPTPEENLC